MQADFIKMPFPGTYLTKQFEIVKNTTAIMVYVVTVFVSSNIYEMKF